MLKIPKNLQELFELRTSGSFIALVHVEEVDQLIREIADSFVQNGQGDVSDDQYHWFTEGFSESMDVARTRLQRIQAANAETKRQEELVAKKKAAIENVKDAVLKCYREFHWIAVDKNPSIIMDACNRASDQDPNFLPTFEDYSTVIRQLLLQGKLYVKDGNKVIPPEQVAKLPVERIQDLLTSESQKRAKAEQMETERIRGMSAREYRETELRDVPTASRGTHQSASAAQKIVDAQLAEPALRAVSNFMSQHPEYSASRINADLLIGWLKEHHQAVTLNGLNQAFAEVRSKLELNRTPEGQVSRMVTYDTPRHQNPQADIDPVSLRRFVEKLDATSYAEWLAHTATPAQRRALGDDI